MPSQGIAEDGGGLRERRLALDLSQEKLARLADCSLSTIRLIEKGYTPSAAMTERLAEALNRAAAAQNEVND